MQNLTALIRPHLDAGEQILWSGRPRQGIVLRYIDAFLIPFSAVWALGVMYWTLLAFGTVLKKQASNPSLIDWPFLLVGSWMSLYGLYMLFGRFIADAYHRSKLVYAITDQRALILSLRPWSSSTSIALTDLQNHQVVEYRSGRGTIHLAPPTAQAKPAWRTTSGAHPMFFQIANVRKVFGTLRQAIERSLQNRSRN
jgi:hypothetical protein